MSAQPSTAYQFNFRIGENLFNIYAENGQDAIDQLTFFEESLIPLLASVGQKTAAVGSVVPALPVAPAVQQNLTAPPATTPTSADGQHLCAHGRPMKLIPAGISKATGKPYKAFYVCNQPRGMQCDTTVTV